MMLAQKDLRALYCVRLDVQNVNLISSPLTYGFPAVTAFTGFAHAFERWMHTQAGMEDIGVLGVAVVCHAFDAQISQGGSRHQPKSLKLARHPNDKEGNPPPIVEEGRGHMTVSLVFGLGGAGMERHLAAPRAHQDALNQQWWMQIQSMRLAGGSVLPARSPHEPLPLLVAWQWPFDIELESQRRLQKRLLPGFLLQDASEILIHHQHWLSKQRGQSIDRLEAWLDLSRLNFSCQEDSENDDEQHDHDDQIEIETVSKKVQWRIRPRPDHQTGWLVPMPLGYAALTDVLPAGTVSGARDNTVPMCFVEPLLGIGRWVSPHGQVVQRLHEQLWTEHAQPEQGVYQCVQPLRQTHNQAR